MKIKQAFCMAVVASLFCGCAATKISEKDVKMPPLKPKAKITNFTKALKDLGLMTEIYATGGLKIQSNPIGDNTGSSGATGGEIPRDITEMIKSALNSIGGGIIYIPYDPAFIGNQMNTGYSDFQNKLVPEVVITGGITEFDRGLNTVGDGTSLGASVDIVSAPKIEQAGLGSSVNANYDNIEKSGLSRITLDFNLIDFNTMAGIPQMNTINTIEVNKVMKDKSLGINILGVSFGSKGSVKRVQGRHHAIRTLVEISMIQMVGKYLGLPYWRLLGKDALKDEIVEKNFIRSYYQWNTQSKIAVIQEWLYIHGYDLYVNGVLDEKTSSALNHFIPSSNGQINANVAWKIYSTLPINTQAYNRRMMLLNGAAQPPAPKTQTYQEPQKTQEVVEQKKPVKKAKRKSVKVKKSIKKSTKTIRSVPAIGRIINDKEW